MPLRYENVNMFGRMGKKVKDNKGWNGKNGCTIEMTYTSNMKYIVLIIQAWNNAKIVISQIFD